MSSLPFFARPTIARGFAAKGWLTAGWRDVADDDEGGR